jgi:phospholipid/cholesterol/gamma-HCH transport system substrate-binding protein
MEAEAKYTYVGVAVLVLLATLVAAVVWLKNTGSARNFINYTIYFERQALDGLQIGGGVVLRGIKVGRVEDYSLAGQKVNRVRATIRVDWRTPVLTNTVATISRNLVTGIAQIVLVNPEPIGTTLEIIPEGEAYPVIAEGSSDMQEFAGRVSELGDRAATVMDNLNKLLSQQNLDSLQQTLANVSNLTAAANARVESFDDTLTKFGDSATTLARAGDRIAVAAGKLGNDFADSAAKANGNLSATLAEATLTLKETRRTAAEASRAAATLQTEVATLSKRIEATAMSLDDQATATLTELHASSQALNRTLDRLQDPRAALLGPGKAQLGPGERK